MHYQDHEQTIYPNYKFYKIIVHFEVQHSIRCFFKKQHDTIIQAFDIQY